MDAIAALSSSFSQSQIAAAVAVQVLKRSNQQQLAVLSLLDDAVQTAEKTQEAGKGENVDTYG